MFNNYVKVDAMTESTTFIEEEPQVEGSDAETQAAVSQKARVWPLVVVVAIQAAMVAVWLTPSINNFIRFVVMMAGPLICGLLFALLLLFMSKLRKRDALLVLVATATMGIVVAATAAPRSATGAWFLGIPLAMLMGLVGLIASGIAESARRRNFMIGFAAIAWVVLSMTRIDGVDGAYVPEMSWRWTQSPEQQALAGIAAPAEIAAVSTAWAATETGWPAFRGPRGDSRVTESVSPQDWEAKPPAEVWRRPVGPGWSSMAVVSGRLFTQEQRGEEEAVTCYDAATGEPIWVYQEPNRFEELVSGAGPRATPTFLDGRIYAYGAKAFLVVLDANDGSVIWRKDLMKDYSATAPMWGFSSSPVVTDGLLIVCAGGRDNNGLVAFDAETGDEVWKISSPGENYVSAQLMTLAGTRQLVFTQPGAVVGMEIASGTELWRAEVINERDFPMVQPQQIDDTHIVVATGDGRDTVCVEVRHDDSWSAKKDWQSRYLKPSFNDFVSYKGSLYGFDKQIFASIDAATGERNWKAGRYGFGQAILLEQTGQIVVAAESGELVLLNANTKELTEAGRVPAMSAKTWNHPAINNGHLFVRNAEEMVCYDLSI